MATVQISAHISSTTKRELERYSEAHGMKMGFVIEDALLHHLQALRRLPQDVLVPARLVVSPESFEEVAERVRKPRRPAPAMRALMKKPSRG